MINRMIRGCQEQEKSCESYEILLILSYYRPAVADCELDPRACRSATRWSEATPR